MVNKKLARIVGLFLIVSLLHYDCVCWAAPVNKSESIQNEAFSGGLEESLGVKVYIIEDAHCLPSTQREIAGILGNLYENEGVQSIYIEGCSGAQDFDYLRSYPLKAHKTQLLDEYLKEGKISGVEYFSALLPESLPLKVHGIEDKTNYQENIDALCRLTTQRNVAGKLEILKTFLQVTLEQKISFIKGYDPYDPATMSRVISEGSISISAQLQQRYPVIWQYIDGVEQLSDISLLQVVLEGKKFIEQYSSRNIKQRVTALLIDPYTSWSIDQSIIDQIGDCSAYTHLKQYLSIVQNVSNFNTDDILENLSHFLEEYAYSYCDSDYTFQLVKAYFFCLQFEKLAALEFSEQQLSVCQQTVVPALPASLPADMRETFSQILTMYSGLLDDAVSFYESARNRNSYLYDNFLKQFVAANESCAIVIGGFHSKDLQQLIASHNMNFEVIRPGTIVGSGIDKNVYFQHFVSGIPQVVHGMPNNSSLAPAPILSLSNDFISVDAPSHNWFNMFFDQLVEPLKKMPSLAVGWMKSISRQMIRQSGKTLRGLFLLTMISTAVAGIRSNALGSEEAMPGNRMEQFYLAPGQTEGGTESIEELLIENRFKYHTDYKDAKELTKYLESNIMHLQDAAIQLLEERHDIDAMVDYIEHGENLNVKQVFIGLFLAEKNYAALFQTGVMLDKKILGAQHEELKSVYDSMIISAVAVQPDFFDDLQQPESKSVRRSAKYMLAYYMQVTAGSVYDSFARAFFTIASDNDLKTICAAFDATVSDEYKTSIFFDPIDSTPFTHHSKAMRDSAFSEMLKRTLENVFSQITETTPYGIQGLLNRTDRIEAQDMLRLIQSDDLQTVKIIEKLFPSHYQAAIRMVNRSLAEFSVTLELYDARPYPFTYFQPLRREVNYQVSFDFSSPIAHKKAADLNYRIKNWTVLNQYLFSGEESVLKESMIQKYYSDNHLYLAGIYSNFKGSSLGNIIKAVINESLQNNSDNSFDLEKYTTNGMSYLLLVSRVQRATRAGQWAFEYLITHIPSDYSLAMMARDRQIAGIDLTDQEVVEMEAELSRRFALRYLEDMIARRQQEHTNALFSQYDERITDMQADIRLLSRSAVNNGNSAITKYGLENEYNAWINKLDTMQNSNVKRVSVIEKLLKRLSIPLSLVALLLTAGGFLKNRLRRDDTLSKSSTQETEDDSDPMMEDAVAYIKYFAAQPLGAVSFTTLQQLDASITKLDDTLHVRIAIDTIISVFKLLNETASLHTDSGVSLLARNLFIKLQNSVTVKERSRTSLPQKNDFSSEAQVRGNMLLSTFKTMLYDAGVQDETVRRLSRLIQIDTFWKQLKNVRFKIKIFKYAQFMVTTCFFCFVLLAMPVADVSAGLIFIGLLAIVQAVEHAVYHYILHSSETISKWFELHLKRIEELSGIQRGNLARYAYYLAMGESSQWYVMTIALNLLGAGLVISLMNPLLLVPYSVTIAVSFYIIIKNINGNGSFSSLQSSYLEGVQQIDQELGVAGFMGRTTQIDQQWESRLSKGLTRFIRKAKGFNGILMFATKVMLPAIGLISGHILEFYIISGYLAVILGAGDFIKALGESSLYSSRINGLLDKIIKNDQVVSEQTWQSDQRNDLYGSEINPLLIKSYQFDAITSSIKNRAGKPVVRSVSLTVDQGEMLFIGAPSGSGKSMLAKLFTHNMNPASGTSAINLLDGTTIQISPENVSFDDLKKLFHYIDYSKIDPSITPRQILDQFDKDSEAFISFISGIFPEFTELSLKKTFSEFSHGEQKRIASALYLYINEPPFIIFDEPLSGLDADSAQRVMEFLIDYKKHHNTTIIVIDHHVSENMLTSFDRKMTLSAGNLVPYSKREELQKWLDTSIDMKEIAEPVAQDSISESPINNEQDDIIADQDQTQENELQEYTDCPEWLSHVLRTLNAPDFIGTVSNNVEDESIDSSIMRILLILEMFGREDIYGKTAIWDFLKQRNEPEYKLAFQVIQKLCSQTNDYIDSETQNISFEAISCNNTKNVLRTLRQVIQNNRDQYPSYATYTDNISYTGLLQKMYRKKSKKRDRYIQDMLESTADKKVALSFSNTRKSIYDIMAVDYLFQQHNIDRKYIPYVLKNFSLTTFRARLSTLMSYNLPVNTSTLRLSTDQKVSDYAEHYRLRQTVQTMNETDMEGSQNPHPIKPIDPAHYKLLDSAA